MLCKIYIEKNYNYFFEGYYRRLRKENTMFTDRKTHYLYKGKFPEVDL